MRLIAFLLLISQVGFSQNQQMLMRTKVAAAPSFSPTDISGLKLWLDGADTDGDGTLNEETTISTWYDKSGNGYDFTSTGTPILNLSNQNGNNTVELDGSTEHFQSDELASSGVWNFMHEDDVTIFMVLASDNWIDTEGYLSTVASSSGTGFITFSSATFDEICILDANGSSYQPYYACYLQSGQGLVNGSFSSVLIKTDVDAASQGDRTFISIDGGAEPSINRQLGEQVSTSFSSPDYTLKIGNNGSSAQYFDGNIAEVIIYSRLLTSSEITDLYTYLDSKWAL